MQIGLRRRWILALALGALSVPASAQAEWQVRPFVGLTFGTDTTIVADVEPPGKRKLVVGLAGAFLWDIFGIEADFSRSGGFFHSDSSAIITGSRLVTLSGNVTLALPRRMTEYTLRPYFVGGAGLMHVGIDQAVTTLSVSSNLTTTDLGGGVTGFITDQVGLNWDVRHFRAYGVPDAVGTSFGPEKLSFWRANMALAIRY